MQCISDIRLALGDEGQTILKTVARRGYLFAASVAEVEPLQGGTESAAKADGPIAPLAPIGESADSGATVRGRAFPARRPAILIAALSACAIVAAGAALVWWQGRWGTDAGRSPAASELVEASLGQKRASIAVLPLVAIGSAADDEYFADGLTEDIIAALGRFSELSVIAPTAVAAYKGKSLRPEEIGRELKVRYIAEGSLRRTPERIRITIRLTDASLGTLLWADRYDAEPESIFAIQDNITRQITGALAVRLSNVEQARVAAKPPSSLEAYDLTLRGRDSLSRLTRSATSKARGMFERAVELDPNYAAAYVGLGRVDLTAVALGWTPDPAGALQRAESLARKAIGIDEFSPGAYVLLGRTYARLGEYDRATSTLTRAMALNPSDPDSYAGLGDALLWSGDVAGAIKHLETAAQLDPRLSSEDLFDLGTAYFLAANATEAVRAFERTVARNDSTAFIHAMLAAVHAEAGRKAEADRELAEVRRRDPFFDVASFGSLFRNPEHRQRIVSALHKAGF